MQYYRQRKMELLVTETLGLGKRIGNTFAGSQMDALLLLLLLPSLLIAANALRHRFRLDIPLSEWNTGWIFGWSRDSSVAWDGTTVAVIQCVSAHTVIMHP